MTGTGPGLRVAAVRVLVKLRGDEESREQAERLMQSLPDAPIRHHVVGDILDPSQYQMYASLIAELSDGREIATGIRDFGWSSPRQGLGAIAHRYRGPKLSTDPEQHMRLLRETYHVSYTDIQDHVDAMLGRDPELHRPPRMAWDNLLRALTRVGIKASQDDLIAAPLILVLSDEVKTEIASGSESLHDLGRRARCG